MGCFENPVYWKLALDVNWPLRVSKCPGRVHIVDVFAAFLLPSGKKLPVLVSHHVCVHSVGFVNPMSVLRVVWSAPIQASVLTVTLFKTHFCKMTIKQIN